MDGVGSGTSGTHRTPFRSSDQTQSDEASEGRGESTAGRRGDRRSRGRWSAKGSAVANVTAAVRGSGPFLLVLLSRSPWGAATILA